MRVQISQRRLDGLPLDTRAQRLTSEPVIGRLQIRLRGGQLCATFTGGATGTVNLLPPLWRTEVISLDSTHLILSGVQRINARSPLQYQEWSCFIMDTQRKP